MTQGPSPSVSERALAAAIEHDLFGRYEQAALAFDALIAAARADQREHGVLATALARRAGLLRYAGDLAGAGRLLTEASTALDADPAAEPVIAAAVATEWGRYLSEADGPDRAQAALDRAIGLAGSIPPGMEQALAMADAAAAQGAAERLRGAYATAEATLLEAVRWAEAAVDLDGHDVRAGMALVHALDELGVLYKFSGAFEASATAYERARSLLVDLAGPEHPDLATIDHNLGGLAHARGDGPAAEQAARRAVEIHERSLGPDHLATVLDRSALAAVLDQQGATEEALRLLADCAERLERVLGPDHRELAVVLNNQAAIQQRAGQLAEAEALYTRSLAIKEQALGPDAPSLAITLNNLGTVQRRLGRVDAAITTYERALSIVLAAAGPEHPHAATIRRNLARLTHEGLGDVSGR